MVLLNIKLNLSTEVYNTTFILVLIMLIMPFCIYLQIVYNLVFKQYL